MNSAAEKLVKRLSSYWKMEAGNVLLIPGAILVLGFGKVGWVTFLACVPMAGLLIIGAAYWRGKLRSITDQDYDFSALLRWIAMAQIPFLLITLVSVGLVLRVWIWPEVSVGIWDRWAATGATSLAVLEYINYYHRQLQHFDHTADLKRLMSGRGFRRSQMAKDLSRLREGRL